MDFSSSSVSVILNGKCCRKEFQSLADLTGRLEEKTDDAERDLPGQCGKG